MLSGWARNVRISTQTTALERPVIQLLEKFETFSLRQFSLCGTVMGLTETIVRLIERIIIITLFQEDNIFQIQRHTCV